MPKISKALASSPLACYKPLLHSITEIPVLSRKDLILSANVIKKCHPEGAVATEGSRGFITFATGFFANTQNDSATLEYSPRPPPSTSRLNSRHHWKE